MKSKINSIRHLVLPVNRINFNLVCESYLEEISKRPAEYDTLSLRLSERLEDMLNRNIPNTPPMLCRRIGESNKSLLQRMYESGGYKDYQIAK